MKLFRRDPSEKSAFLCFFGGFSLSPSFFAMYGAFLGIFWVGVGIGDEQGSIFSCPLFGFLHFWPFLAFFGIFLAFFGF